MKLSRPSSRAPALLAACLSALLAACGGGGSSGDGASAPPAPISDTTPRPAGTDPDFSAKTLQSLATTGEVTCPSYQTVDFKALGVTCYSSDVPENYKQPQGTRIKVLTMVLRTPAAQPKGSVYLLDGGPGGNGLGYLAKGKDRREFVLTDELLADGWDVIVPGHRGTHSSALSCPKAEKAQQDLRDPKGPCASDSSRQSLTCQALENTAGSCLDELIEQKGGGAGGALATSQYDTVNAARDIVAAQPAVLRPNAPVTTVLGVSYGTYWAQRLAQLHPGAASRVVLDSSMNLLGRVEEIDPHTATLLEDVLADCQADADCKTRLGTSDTPKALVTKAMDRIASGQCGADVPADVPGVSFTRSDKWRLAGYGMPLHMALARPESRPVVPYLVKIAADCNQGRVKEVLAHMKAKMDQASQDTGAPPPLAEQLNAALHQTVLFSELVNAKDPKTRDNIDRVELAQRDSVFPGGQAAELQQSLKYAAAMVFNGVERVFSTIQAKLLVLSARVDMQTPRQVTDEMVAAMKKAGLAPERHDASFAGHGVVDQACARQRTLLFLNGKDGAGFSCTEPSIDWSFSRPETRRATAELIGKEDPWIEVTLPIESRPSGTSGI